MLKYNFDRLFSLHGISKPIPYLINAGFSRGIASRMLNGKHSALPLKYVEKICIKFKCTPNDLLEWTPDDPSHADLNIPLAKLLAGDSPVFSMRNISADIPYEKLSEFAQKVKELKNEMVTSAKANS